MVTGYAEDELLIEKCTEHILMCHALSETRRDDIRMYAHCLVILFNPSGAAEFLQGSISSHFASCRVLCPMQQTL